MNMNPETERYKKYEPRKEEEEVANEGYAMNHDSGCRQFFLLMRMDSESVSRLQLLLT